MFNLQQISKAILCLAALTCATLAAQSGTDGGKNIKKRIGVVAFENDTQYKELSARMADMLVSGLSQNSRNFELVERARLNSVIEEQGLGMTGIISQSGVAQLGQICGLDYIMLGTILEARADETSSRKGAVTGAIGGAVLGSALGGRVGAVAADSIADASSGASYSTNFSISITVKVVEVETGRVLLVQDASAEDTRSWGKTQHTVSAEDFSKIARDAAGEAARNIIWKLDPMEQPVVLQVRGREVLINKGLRDGIRVGQRFAILREGEVVHDLNGAVLSVRMIELASIDVTLVEDSIASGYIDRLYKDPLTKQEYTVKRGDLLSMRFGRAESVEGKKSEGRKRR